MTRPAHTAFCNVAIHHCVHFICVEPVPASWTPILPRKQPTPLPHPSSNKLVQPSLSQLSSKTFQQTFYLLNYGLMVFFINACFCDKHAFSGRLGKFSVGRQGRWKRGMFVLVGFIVDVPTFSETNQTEQPPLEQANQQPQIALLLLGQAHDLQNHQIHVIFCLFPNGYLYLI